MSMYYRKKTSQASRGGAARGGPKARGSYSAGTPARKSKLAAARAGAYRAQAVTPAYKAAYYARSGVGSVEHKTFDPVVLGTNNLISNTSSAVAVSGSGYITANASAHVVNQVPQGTTSSTRIGRKMRMTAIHVKGTMQSDAASNSCQLNRWALVYIPKLDRTTTTMPPQNVIWTSQDSRAQRVINEADRFTVIKQCVYNNIGDFDAPSTGLEQLPIDEYIKLNHATVWTQADTTGSFDNMQEGALCIYVNGSANNTCTMVYTCRLYFEDA